MFCSYCIFNQINAVYKRLLSKHITDPKYLNMACCCLVSQILKRKRLWMCKIILQRHGRFQFLCATALIHEVYENNGKKTSSLLVCIWPRTVHHITVWLAHAGKEPRLNIALPQVLMAKVMHKIPITFIIMPVFAWEKTKS